MMTPLVAQGWVPKWPVASHVKAYFSTRQGGVSLSPWHSLNLGDHVGDQPAHVAANRSLLAQGIGAAPVFMKQVHGSEVLDLDAQTPHGLAADACWTAQPGVACTIMVADCLPVLFTDAKGSWVAAAHAGWRGLAGIGMGMGLGLGVLEATLARCLSSASIAGLVAADVQVWLGPCIGPQAFEVGAEVRAAFCAFDPAAEQAFLPYQGTTYWADLAWLARLRLQRAGVTAIYGNDSTPAWCTHTQASQFFSHRRDAAVLGTTGRMAACIWLDRG
jgi:YfiH family protein